MKSPESKRAFYKRMQNQALEEICIISRLCARAADEGCREVLLWLQSQREKAFAKRDRYEYTDL
jgi:hypothetical protein